MPLVRLEGHIASSRQLLYYVQLAMRIYFSTLGCKLNQAEVEALGRRAAHHGHQVVNSVACADWAIINTCAVTHVAARKSRHLIRQLNKENAHLRIAVIGCYAEIASGELSAMDGVELVVPNAQKESTLERILSLSPGQPLFNNTLQEGAEPATERTRAFVKVQDGCDNLCTYCIVRVARGPQRSREPDEIVREIGARVGQGYREIVLTGVHIGAYGDDSAPSAPLPRSTGWSLPRLVRAILDGTSVPRLRLSSIEPWDLDPALLTLWEDVRLCRHIHLPLQSGCNATLARMGRKYTTEQFLCLLQRIRDTVPGIAVTTDVIVGFPGETDCEFKESLRFVQRAEFSRLHVFRYSVRQGTIAAEMDEQVPYALAQQRSRQMMALGRELSLQYHRRFVERDLSVLFETSSSGPKGLMWSGLSDNYIRVRVQSDLDLTNTVCMVRGLKAEERGLVGELQVAAPARTTLP